MKIRKTVIYAFIALSIFAVFGLAYVSFLMDDTSALLADAAKAMSQNRPEKARAQYLLALKKDYSCEEAYLGIAHIDELKGNYYESAQCWSSAFALNPLDADLRLRMFRALIISRADQILISKFKALQDSALIGDEYFYHCVNAFMRQGFADEAALHIAELAKLNPDYAKLAEGNLALLQAKSAAAEEFFAAAAKSQKPSVRLYAALGKALILIERQDYEAAKAVIAPLPLENILARADILIAKAECDVALGDPKSAINLYKEAWKLQRANLVILVKAAELAFSVGDPSSIAELEDLLDADNKNLLMLRHYLGALQCGADKNWKNAQKNLDFAGPLKSRNAAMLLSLNCAIDAKDPDAALETALKIRFETLAPEVGRDVAASLINLMRLPQSTPNAQRELALAALRADPQNLKALDIAAEFAVKDARWEDALKFANASLEIDPKSVRQCVCGAIAAFNLGDWRESLRLCDRGLKLEKSSMLILCAARACASGKDTYSASKYYEELLKSSNAPDYAEEAALFYISEGMKEKAQAAIDAASAKPALREALEGALSKENKDWTNAAKHFENALKLNPDSEKLYAELSSAFFELKDFDRAQAVLENALKTRPSNYLKYQQALLLMNLGGDVNLKKAANNLEEIYPDKSQLDVYAPALCEAYANLGQLGKAFDIAMAADKEMPRSAPLLNTLGRILYMQRSYAGAVRFLSDAYALKPDAATRALLVKAYVGAAAQDPDPLEKRTFLREALALSPNDASALEAMKDASKQ